MSTRHTPLPRYRVASKRDGSASFIGAAVTPRLNALLLTGVGFDGSWHQ